MLVSSNGQGVDRFRWWVLSSWATIGLSLLAAVPKASVGFTQPAERTNPVTYEISVQLVFTPPVGTKVAHVWMVKPPNDEGQEVLKFESEPMPTLEAPDPLYGNQLVYWRLDNPEGAQVIRYRLRVRAYELRWHLQPDKVNQPDPKGMAEWLRHETYIIVNDPRIRSLAQQLVRNASTPFEKVRRVLEYVIDTMKYSHAECSLSASALHAYTARTGHCSDYHGFSTALLRSLGFPARVTYGINPFKRRSPSHCKLEVFLPPYGWVPFDLSETDKVLETWEKAGMDPAEKASRRAALMQWLFSGFRDNTWYRTAVGTDFPLVPAVAPNPPLIRTFYIVCDDKVLPEPDPANPNKMEFAWQEVWEVKQDRETVHPWSLWLKP